MERSRRVLGAVAILALVGTACSDDGEGRASPASTTAAGTTAGVPPCSAVSLASLGPQSGPDAATGLNQSRAVELAIQEFNAANPGCVVGYQPFDSEGSTEATTVVAQRIAQDTSIIGVLGPMSTSASLAAIPILEAVGVDVITPSASDPSLSMKGWKVFHRAIATSDDQARAMGRYVAGELAARSVAVLDDGSDAAHREADIVRETVTEAGASVAVMRRVDTESGEDPTTVAEVRAADVDAVVVLAGASLAGQLTEQLRRGGVTAELVLGEPALEPEFLAEAGPHAEGVHVIAAVLGTVDGYPGGAQFRTRFEHASGQQPGLFAAEAYDAAGFLLAAIKDGSRTRAQVSAYLAAQRWDGVTKELMFGSNGDLAGEPTVYVNTIEGGQLVGLGAIEA
jgi:branched-chain amino acid transport system substrate-binding protein